MFRSDIFAAAVHKRLNGWDLRRFTAGAVAAVLCSALVPAGALAEETVMNKSTIGAAFEECYRFEKEDAIVYLVTPGTVLDRPYDDAEAIADLEKYEEVHLTGSNDLTYWEIEYNGEIAYIDSSVLTRDMEEILRMREEEIRRVEEEAEQLFEAEESLSEGTQDLMQEWEEALVDTKRQELASQRRNPNWNGPVLSRSKGTNYGPSGKETYYNLNMSVCVRNMYRRGYSGDVWVRDDGCKMFGDYIMCAANLGLHPFGSLVESSLGTCIVVDTGGFASHNENQLDIAVTW